MSIIIILMSVLVPGLNRARIFAKIVTQKGQFHEISKGLELFRNDHQETYPDSGAADTNGRWLLRRNETMRGLGRPGRYGVSPII